MNLHRTRNPVCPVSKDQAAAKPLRSPFCAVGLVIVCLTGAGCETSSQWMRNGFKLGPNYETPIAATGDEWIDHADPDVISQPPRHEEWWKVFDDPVLDDLIEKAYRQNLTLREAGLRVLQARAQRAIVGGDLYPQSQQAFGQFERILESQQEALPSPLRSLGDWSTGFNLSWELDVWGKLRRAIESSDASLEASIQDYDAILVSLVAEVATAYAEIRTFERRLEFARGNVNLQKKSLELTSERADAGATSEVGVNLARASLEATRAGIPDLESGLRQTNNRLCTLLGIPPEDFVKKLGRGKQQPTVPPTVAVGIPADLLRRRPDVREAAAAVAAQSARIGIAEADLYPSFAISGQIYVAAEEFGDLFGSRSSGGAVGPSFGWNILNYGRLVNNVRLQELRALELVERYKGTVLAANQEVEDALVAFLKSREQAKSLANSAAETNRSLALLQIQFEEGKIEYSPIFVVQGFLTSIQDQQATAEGNVFINLIKVYKALGGGWQIRRRAGSADLGPSAVTGD